MPTEDNQKKLTFNAEEIRELIAEMQQDSLTIFASIISEVKDHGNALTDVVINELARKYADKARMLAKAGEEE
ncbi:MAG: hypothetical protein C4555_07955 [Dehalococcoidia bacterium]|nr:MAG: hypothetical protein C4555_07955 [Dehalococcoidia bacterium]